MEKDVQEKIKKLQLIEESLHSYLGQKQQVQAQLMELESAAEALTGAERSYKIIGSIMVEKPADELKKEVSERQERIKLRIAVLEKHEERLKGQADSLQQEIMNGMKGESRGDV